MDSQIFQNDSRCSEGGQAVLTTGLYGLFSLFCLKQIHNRWKLQSIEQQQKEVQAKQQAREQAKKAQGTNNTNSV